MTIPEGTPVVVAMGPVGVVEHVSSTRFAEPTIRSGHAGVYHGRHPHESDWHMVRVELDGATYYAPLPEGWFKIAPA